MKISDERNPYVIKFNISEADLISVLNFQVSVSTSAKKNKDAIIKCGDKRE